MGRAAVDRRWILLAAREQLLLHGVADTTYDQIATAASVSRATVYRAVGPRDDLVRALLVEEAEVLFANVDEAMRDARAPDELVAAGVAAALTTIRDRPLLRRLAGTDLPHILPVLTVAGVGVVSAAVHQLVPLLERAAGDGLIADEHLVDIAEELVRYVLALVHTPVLDGGILEPTAGGRRAARLFGPALTPAHGFVRAI